MAEQEPSGQAGTEAAPDLKHDPRFTEERIGALRGAADLAGDTVRVTDYSGTEEIEDGVKHYMEYEDKDGGKRFTTLDQFLWMNLPDSRRQQLEEAGMSPYDLVAGTDPILQKVPAGVTLEPEPPTQEQPTVEIPNADLNPTVTVDFDPSMQQSDVTKHLVRKVQADAKLRGFEDMSGLDLTVQDDEGQKQRFVVIDGSSRPVTEPIRVAHGLPHFVKPVKIIPVEDAPHVPSRLKLQTGLERKSERRTQRKVGLPRIVKKEGRRTIGRKEEPIDPVYRKFVTVQIYDNDDNMIGIETKRLSDFYAIAGSALLSDRDEEDPGNPQAHLVHPQAQWNWKGRETKASTNSENDLAIGLRSNRGRSAFEDITDQLEAHNITNWTGLTWKLVKPGKGPGGNSTDATKRGIPMHERTQTIIHDGTVKEPTYNGLDTRYARAFLLRTTDHYADGSEVVVNDKKMKDYELWEYLEGHLQKARDFKEKSDDPDERHESLKATGEHPVIWDMRMSGAAEQPTSEFKMPEITDRVYGLPQHISLDEALGMLSYPELYPRNEKGNTAFEQHIDMLKEGEEKKYGEELQKIISEVGFEHFHAIVQKMHGEVYSMYASSAERLDMPDTPAEQYSASWIIEGLAKRSRENRLEGNDDPFGHVLTMPHLLRDLTDEHLGEMFGHASIRVSKIMVPDGVKEDGTQKIKEKIVHRFNEDLFETLPIIKNPDNMVKIKKWRDKIWKPIEELTREIYDAHPSPDDEKAKKARDVTYEDYQKLGRMLRRTIGE